MKPSPSPPQEAEHIRHQQLTPESPRPQNVPAPTNIPILVEQMDLNYNGNQYAVDQSQQAHPQSHTPNIMTSTFPDHSAASNYHNFGAQGMGAGAPPGMAGAQSTSYGGGMAAQQAPGTHSIQNFTQQQRPASASDVAQLSGQQPHSAYPYSHDNNAYAPQQQAPGQSALGNLYQTEGYAGNNTVDVQALLDSLTPAMNMASAGQFAASQVSPSAQGQAQSPSTASSLPNATTNLPPRPPAQDKPATHPNYNPNDDIRSFHPHSQKASTGRATPPPGASASAAPATQSSNVSGQPPRQSARRSTTPDDEDARWPPEINKLYEDFLKQERDFVTEGQWDQFPAGSRLFIGNLPTEKVTKRDIFHRFHRHGQLAQISIKQAYGFVQFLDSESCRRALDHEQGAQVRGRKMHLEISKPQRNTKKAEPQNNGGRRRSRSPDYTRGGSAVPPRERYPGPMSPRDRDRRFREREEYRPMRSPSPRRGMRSRDRSRDRFERYRSRSRTPPRRYRSPSPGRRGYTEDGLDLPRRQPHEVPDIQILVLNENLRGPFIHYVEDAFRRQNLRSNVLVMSGRFPEPAVVRRQILEGVLAIVRIDTTGFHKGRVSVQIFDRKGSANNVQFNDYADLDPATAALLVDNAKRTQAVTQAVQPPTAFPFPPHNLPAFTQPPSNPYPTSPGAAPNVSNLITSLDPASLHQLLAAMSNNNTPANAMPAGNPGISADLARLLAQVPSPSQTPGFGGQAQAHLANASLQFPGLAQFLQSQGQQMQPPQQQSAPPVQTPSSATKQPDMNEIMAQLAQYQR